jgi:hypothetical protein
MLPSQAIAAEQLSSYLLELPGDHSIHYLSSRSCRATAAEHIYMLIFQ